MMNSLQRLQLFDALGGLHHFAATQRRVITTMPIKGYFVSYFLKNVQLGDVWFGYVECDHNKLVVAPFHWEPVEQGYEELSKIATRQAKRRR